MKTFSRLALATVISVFAGCGDNWEQRECGPGTHEENGQCLPDGTGPSCGDGTVLDPASGTCVPDPSVCGEGTVLVNGMCQDVGIVDPDAEEAPEPNDGVNPGEL